jgi:hypothetical protein
MTTLRLVLRRVSERLEEWHHDRLFAAWRAQRLARRGR